MRKILENLMKSLKFIKLFATRRPRSPKTVQALAWNQGRNSVSEFETTRKIALLIAFLKDQLKPKGRTKLSDEALATLLDSTQQFSGRSLSLDGNRVNQIRNGRTDIGVDEQAKLLHAIRALMHERHVNIISDITKESLPKWVEDQYGDQLPNILKRPATPLFRGDPLGPLAEVLPGAWQCFYVSPVDRSDRFKAEIRGFAALFQDAKPSSTIVDTLLISGQGRFKGYSFVNDTHLYIMCTDAANIETVFFTINKPTKANAKFAGIGTANARLRPDRPRENPPIVGILCFGEKFLPPERTGRTEKPIIERVLRGESISEDEEKTIRQTFGKIYKSSRELHKKHRELYAYIRVLKINNREGFPMQGLHVAWS